MYGALTSGSKGILFYRKCKCRSSLLESEGSYWPHLGLETRPVEAVHPVLGTGWTWCMGLWPSDWRRIFQGMDASEITCAAFPKGTENQVLSLWQLRGHALYTLEVYPTWASVRCVVAAVGTTRRFQHCWRATGRERRWYPSANAWCRRRRSRSRIVRLLLTSWSAERESGVVGGHALL